MFQIRRTFTAVFVATALVATLTSPSVADSKKDLERQKRESSSRIEDAKKALDGSTKKFADAVKALRAAQGRLDRAQANLGSTRGKLAVAKERDNEVQAKLVASEAELDLAVIKLKKGSSRLRASQASVEQFTVQNLEQGDRGLRAFGDLIRGQDPIAYSEQMSLSDAVSDDQTATMQRLAATKIILKLNRQKVKKLRDQVKEQRRIAAANLVEKVRLENAAETQTVQVTELVTARTGARNSAASIRAEDEKNLREQEQERASLSARLRALAAKAVRTGGKGSGGDSGGTLSYPANGPITSPYGMRKHPVTGVYKLHDGTDFGIPCGTPVRAAASGTIIEQYYNGAYGNRVILDNGVKRGVNVVTTYNHLSRFALSSGSKVKRGQVIAYSGTTGYSTGCHLHFMVIANGATTNPMGWL